MCQRFYILYYASKNRELTELCDGRRWVVSFRYQASLMESRYHHFINGCILMRRLIMVYFLYNHFNLIYSSLSNYIWSLWTDKWLNHFTGSERWDEKKDGGWKERMDDWKMQQGNHGAEIEYYDEPDMAMYVFLIKAQDFLWNSTQKMNLFYIKYAG